MKSSVILSALALAVPAVMATVPIYYQCGGSGYTGETECDPGLDCVFQNEWYSQCLPGSGNPAPSSTKATSSTKAASSSTKTSSSSTKPTSSTKTTSSAVVTAAPTGLTTALPASSGYSAFATASVISGTFD
ncbi:hypothetical protein FRC02_005328, partial [Tulasnella sp. 418]